MIQVIIELEKCTLQGKSKDRKTMKAISNLIFKLQMNTNLYEAALNKEIKGKTLFEKFIHIVTLNNNIGPLHKIQSYFT